MLLSIIIPSYNSEQFIKKCIKSCETQNVSSEEYELIIVDDGSEDKSLAIIKMMALVHRNIKIYSQPNRGLSVARNIGMKYAKGEYLMFVDSDDWIKKNCFQRIFYILQREKPDALAFCAAYADAHIFERRFSYKDETNIKGRDFLCGYVPDCAPFAIWRAEFFKGNNLLFKEGIYHEDSELIPRAYYLADKITRINDIIYYVYRNPDSITRSVNYKRAFDSIQHVCTSLDNFYYTKVEKKYRWVFDKRISIYINNALNVCCDAPELERSFFSVCMYDNRRLWIHLKNSPSVKYKIEYYLFCLCPRNTLLIYRCLKKYKIK